MGFARVSEFARAQSEGRWSTATIRKVPTNASTAGRWVDLSGAPNIPVPNYFASSPLVAATLDQEKGIFHGLNRAPAELYMQEWSMVTPSANALGDYRCLDYVLYYPFIEGDNSDEQALDNTVTLPRYQDGIGLQIMLVAQAPMVGGGTFNVRYVNENDVERTTPTYNFNVVATNIGEIATSEQANLAGGFPCVPLVGGDRGVKRILGITVPVAAGGLFAAVLVKPLASLALREIGTPAEMRWVERRAGTPRIFDGAYLGMVVNCAGSLAGTTVVGRMDFVWSM